MRLPDDTTSTELLQRWHCQVGPRLESHEYRPRGSIAIGYLTNGPVVDELIALEDLMLTVLYDERCPDGTLNHSLLEHALLLDQLVDHVPAGSVELVCDLRLPSLWAAFRPADACTLKPAGPEFEALRSRLGMSLSQLMASYRRRFLGMTLLPLAWVSHAWQQWVTLLADLSQHPQTQRLRVSNPAEQLQGFRDAAGFDLVANRFASQRSAHVRPLAIANA